DVMDFSRTIDISLQMNISNAYQGFSIEYGAAGKNLLRDDGINIRADVSLDNCQQYVRFARVLGGDFNISVKKTSRSQSRTWTRWDKRSFAILGNYVKNAKVSVVGD